MISSAENLIVEALFVSNLQPSQEPSAEAVRTAVIEMILRHGGDGCAACAAAEFGDHPDVAVRRMIWARVTLRTAYPLMFVPVPALQPAR